MSRLYVAAKAGIVVYRVDTRTGSIRPLAGESYDPGCCSIALSADGDLLYSTSPNGVSAFRIDHARGGQLVHINTVTCEIHGGEHIETTSSETGGVVLVSCYEGSISGVCCVKIRADGGLSDVTPDTENNGDSGDTAVLHEGGSNVYQPATGNEQENAHPRSSFFEPRGQWALTSDLGQDRVYVYRLDAEKGTLTKRYFADLEPGAGPRNICFHPRGLLIAYGVNELNCTVNVYVLMPYGTVLGKTLQTLSTLPDGYNNRDHTNAKSANGAPASGPNRPEQTNAAADIHTTPDGRFVYASNCGHDSIVCYSVQEDGLLKLVGFTYGNGKHPSSFTIHSTGRWLVVGNRDSDTVTVFKINPVDGSLQMVADVEAITARCVKFATGSAQDESEDAVLTSQASNACFFCYSKAC